jgi:Domain of unknown function (DUF4384)
VDYYSLDGQVGHLFPNPAEPKNLLRPQTSLLIGHPPGSVPWWILPSFGQELITVIVSTAPLFPTPRYTPEVAAVYINELHRALTRDGPRSDVTGMFYMIRTQERP